jgi:hypothetical protein
MSRSTQWISLAGGIAILGFGIFKLFAPPQPDWIPMILGLLIVAFSVSRIMKNRTEKGESDKDDGLR